MRTLPVHPIDAVWLWMESPDTPMHVGVLAVFTKPRNAPADYLSHLAAELRESGEVAAPWNCRLAGDGRGQLAMRWVTDKSIDLDYHFRHSALPAPGGERELGVMVSRLHSHALDRGRPLWEFHLIEGLERDRFAFYIKVHHALVNNVTAIPLLLSLLSPSARRRHLPPLWSLTGHDSTGGPSEVDAETLMESLRSLPSRAASATASVGRATLGLARDLLNRERTGSFAVPAGAPRSTLNRAINAQRRFATQRFETARIEALATATDSTVNQVLAYLCGSSLRRFFKEYNALPDDSLVGVVPVSLQERDEHNPGNAIAGIRVNLGTDVADPLERLSAVKASVTAVRQDRESLPEEAASAYALMRSMPLFASQLPAVGRLVPPLFNLTTSMTPGSDRPLYFNGARLEAMYPMSMLLQYNALSIDCVSYADTLNIGFTGARDTLPHLQRLAVYVGQAVADLEELLRQKEGGR